MKKLFLAFTSASILIVCAGCGSSGSTQADIDTSAKLLRESAKDSPDYGPDPAVVQLNGGGTGQPGGGQASVPKRGIK